ncbi:MAG: beta-glucoside transporter subunit, partial [Microbacterium sp.]|nr:beta-glucoside transporter subunit [Microbacterium sp.]
MATSPAESIVDAVGGPGNIESLTHCATRLRFQLRDSSNVDQSTVEAIPG